MPWFFWLTFVFFTFFVALTSFGKCCTRKESFKIFFNETELITIHVIYYSIFMCGIHKETFKISRQLIWRTSFQGYRLSERFYGILIKKFDRSGKGVVNFDDFIQCCVVIQVSNRYEVLLHGWLGELARISIWWSNQSLDQLDHILIYSPYTELLWSFSLKNKSRKRQLLLI